MDSPVFALYDPFGVDVPLNFHIFNWMHNHFAMTVTTARNGWYDWFRVAVRNCFWLAETSYSKRIWLPLQAQLLPMWVVAVLIGQYDAGEEVLIWFVSPQPAIAAPEEGTEVPQLINWEIRQRKMKELRWARLLDRCQHTNEKIKSAQCVTFNAASDIALQTSSTNRRGYNS